MQTDTYIDIRGVERRYNEPHTYDLSFYRFDTENALATSGIGSWTGANTDIYSYRLVASNYDEYVALGSPVVRPIRTRGDSEEYRTLTEQDFIEAEEASMYLTSRIGLYYVTDNHTSPNFNISEMNRPLSYSKVDVSENGDVTEGDILITYYYAPSKYVEEIALIPVVTEMPE